MAENLGTAVLNLRTDSTKFDKGMSSAEKRTDKLRRGMKIGAAAAVGIGVAFAVVAKKAIDAADNFAKLSAKVGISVESLSGLEFAAKLSGTSMDAMKTAFTRLAANAVDASQGIGLAKDAFEFLEISIIDTAGEIKPMEALLFEVSDKFSGMEDGTQKAALAMDIFGKSGVDLIPMLNAGSEGIQAMKDEAEELGIVISTKTAEQSERFNDALLKLTSSLQGIIFSILDSGLLDIIVDLAETLADASKNSSVFSTVGNVLAGVMKIIQIAALNLQLGFNLLVLDLLNLVQSTNQLLGAFSPFKSITDDLTSSIDKYNLKITQGKGKIDKIRNATDTYTKEVKQADTATRKHTERLGKFSKVAQRS